MFPSKAFKISFNSVPSPSTITPPLLFFQLFATSSKTLSASPSSLHPVPQCFPIKVANTCNADDVNVKLCFFVKVRKASGLKVAGGRRIGRILAFGIGAPAGLKGRIGCTGVANAGDDEGIGFEFVAGVAGGLKSGGSFDFVP
ncbi:hypothetical protein BOTNAR_0619g00050 [Botryotinia narcissicola]|uniref:Uncharacterized protein n=1 Tax=Botryotinia narcissicola TaxID=278944 RepID=A0A4Z1HM08_9HELO|nr:hypothetical protein BOTNAR_0619g00050 [Botryotinia narcissicola]